PRLAIVETAPEEQVDVAGVAAALLAALAKGQQGALLRDDQRRDAIGVIAVRARLEDRLLLDEPSRAGLGCERRGVSTPAQAIQKGENNNPFPMRRVGSLNRHEGFSRVVGLWCAASDSDSHYSER